ncbi:hypothetical protein HJC10_18980 [Corallococcus exiguus]|uniref:hypothetical protein n=1 Tax=Corallococcus TaxID=83461 RepID=UPI000EC915EA|nr:MULTISPECIES: hypothetical protein [Corallococcus]NNB88733.1 hypothetical protein [Corallococcus exiguus]NNB96211.1 hypothetical protein [Corallococcus exiguus]NNC04929.1 hypothetical protein [Corallococcus exiguus]NPC48723.1 hypothetical protein [Corallococcus exiguus]RKH80189.1 hypothetical protein D7X99_22670 [Corallococcus sp. AB032C]
MPTSAEDTLKQLRDAQQQRKATEREQVAKARATSGKEPFDMEKLRALYNPAWDRGDAPLTPSAIEDYERRYYLESPQVKTLQQFAERLAFLRDNDAT